MRESDLTAALQVLALPVQKIDRRARIPNEKFLDVYFAEIVDKGIGRTEEDWRSKVDAGLSRLQQSGADGCILGVYRLP
jgi:ABC-type amino acid transport substrate-binding protein